jgi:type I restriction-modification system DNA methylase subunit
LKAHLWSAADILRGSLDPADYRQPVMTLLFLKRLNDTFEENAENLIQANKMRKKPYVKEEELVLKVRRPVTETKTITEEEKNERLADSSEKGIE